MKTKIVQSENHPVDAPVNTTYQVAETRIVDGHTETIVRILAEFSTRDEAVAYPK